MRPIPGRADRAVPRMRDAAADTGPRQQTTRRCSIQVGSSILQASGKIIPGPGETHGEGNVTFGFGKRTCIGNHVANDSLFIFIATTLWAMNLERVSDEQGKEILLDTDSFFDTGIVV